MEDSWFLSKPMLLTPTLLTPNTPTLEMKETNVPR